MEFNYVTTGELNKAKKKVTKRMIKNAKSEPRYALTTDQAVEYDEYLKELVDLNDNLYSIQLNLDTGVENPGVRGVFSSLTNIVNKTKKLDTTDYSSQQLGKLQEQLESLGMRLDGINRNVGKIQGTKNTAKVLKRDELESLENEFNMLMRRWGEQAPNTIPKEKIDRMRDLDTRIKRMKSQPDAAVEFMSGDFLKIMREIKKGLEELVELLTLKLEQPRQSVQGSGQVGRFLTPVHLM